MMQENKITLLIKISYEDLAKALERKKIDYINIKTISEFCITTDKEGFDKITSLLPQYIDSSIEEDISGPKLLKGYIFINIPFVKIISRYLQKNYEAKLEIVSNNWSKLSFSYLNELEDNISFFKETAKYLYAVVKSFVKKQKEVTSKEFLNLVYNSDLYCDSKMDLLEALECLIQKRWFDQHDIIMYKITLAVSTVLFAKKINMKITSSSDVTNSKKHIATMFRLLNIKQSIQEILHIVKSCEEEQGVSISETMITDKANAEFAHLTDSMEIKSIEQIIFFYKMKNNHQLCISIKRMYKKLEQKTEGIIKKENTILLNKTHYNELLDLMTKQQRPSIERAVFLFSKLVKIEGDSQIKITHVINLIDLFMYKIIYN